MIAYILRRLFQLIPVILLSSFLVFMLLHLVPGDPAEIGLTRPQLKASYALARHIRRRFTVLDLAAEASCFSECVDRVFAPGGFWG
jgi:glycerol-1-phosphate dehydrogenase [NAD(P)+]